MVASAKRQRIQFEQPVEAGRTVGQGSDTPDNSKADNSSNDIDSSETDASSVDSGLSNFQSKQALGPIRTRARPTFYGISVQTNNVTKKPEWVPDSNEADDIVLLHVRKSKPRVYEYPPGLPPRIEPKSRPWTDEEDEDLRSWVQDYGMQKKWSKIAWCLHRSKDDCQTRYRKIVMTRNRWACRDLEAGLPGWVDHELQVNPEVIAQLLAEDLAKREAARKKADQQAKAARDTWTAREVENATVEHEPGVDLDLNVNLNMKEESEKGARWKANAELRLKEEEDNNGKEPEVESERRMTVKTEDEAEVPKPIKAILSQASIPSSPPNPAPSTLQSNKFCH